jgi:hypothetical protein
VGRTGDLTVTSVLRPRALCRSVPLLVVGTALALGGAGTGISASLQGTADLRVAVSKSPRTASVAAGSTVQYQVTVTNGGPDTATGVTAEMGLVFTGARISGAGTSGGATCTFTDVITGVAGFLQCPLATIAPGGSRTMTVRLATDRSAGKTGGAILVATLSASAADTVDPNDSNSLLIFSPDDAIQYSITGRLGGGTSTAKRIRARVLIAPEGSQDRSVQRYRRLEVFNAPAGSSVLLRGAGMSESGRTGGSGKLRSRKFVNRTFAVGSVLTVRVTKPGRIGDLLRIRVIAGGAKLAGRRCIPVTGGAPRARCR